MTWNPDDPTEVSFPLGLFTQVTKYTIPGDVPVTSRKTVCAKVDPDLYNLINKATQWEYPGYETREKYAADALYKWTVQLYANYKKDDALATARMWQVERAQERLKHIDWRMDVERQLTKIGPALRDYMSHRFHKSLAEFLRQTITDLYKVRGVEEEYFNYFVFMLLADVTVREAIRFLESGPYAESEPVIQFERWFGDESYNTNPADTYTRGTGTPLRPMATGAMGSNR